MIELPWTRQPPRYPGFKQQYGVIAAVTPFGQGERGIGPSWFVGTPSATVTGVLASEWSQFGITTLKDNDVTDYVDFTTGASNEATFLAFWKPNTSGSARRVIDGDDGGSRQYQFRLNSSNQPEFIRFDTGGSPYFATCAAAASSTECCVMIATSSGTSMKMYYARYPFADYLTASGTIGGSPKAMENHRVFASRSGGDAGAAGNHYLELVASRAWSDAEIQTVLRNPWELFEPRRIYVKGASGGAFTLTADAGSFALTGQDATLTRDRVLTADAGSFTLTGQDATLTWGRILAADAGSFTLAGQDATLTHAGAGSFTLVADAGAFALTGQDATLLKTRILTADAGSFSLSGQSATLTWSGEPIVSTPREPQPGIDWGAWVRKLNGPETPTDAYFFTNRRFKDKDNPYG